MSASTADAAALVSEYVDSQRPDLVTAAARLLDVPTGTELVGPDAIGAWFYELTNVAIPSGRIIGRRLHAAADAVVVELTVTGRNDGPFAGRAPSHRPVAIRMCLVCELDRRRIETIRTYYDRAALTGFDVPRRR